ncbi:acyl-CoA reductase [Flexibacter flexilis]|nr:acyl-CoA reductase [Flexibacter flexilis]
MTVQKRIEAFAQLGTYLQNIAEDELHSLAWRAQNANNWFTIESVTTALVNIGQMLNTSDLEHWASKYPISEKLTDRKVGVVMAGNIPAVGFHDWLCVVLAGHQAYLKLSALDAVLMHWLVTKLAELVPEMAARTHIAERLNDVDVIIATGSDNSARYFSHYFGKKPNIIRQNRTSVAILTGTETEEELQQLGSDIFTYYGLGCRNVSKIFIPESYDLVPFLAAQEVYSYVQNHHKYHNNYDYNKSIYLVNRTPHLDTGFLVVAESQELVSPVSVLYYERYANEQDLLDKITALESKIQCVVTNKIIDFQRIVKYGKAQSPLLADYADGVDTMLFLTQN